MRRASFYQYVRSTDLHVIQTLKVPVNTPMKYPFIRLAQISPRVIRRKNKSIDNQRLQSIVTIARDNRIWGGDKRAAVQGFQTINET